MRCKMLMVFVAVLRLNAQGVISTFAGAFPLGDGGPASQAALTWPRGIAFDRNGALYVGEHPAHRVRKILPNGTISTIAGSGSRGFSGDGGPAESAELNFPDGLAIDNEGGLLIADSVNHRIRRVSPNGIITTIAGNGRAGFGGDGGPALLAMLSDPGAVAVAPDGTIYVADSSNHRIRCIYPDGTIDTVAGGGSTGFLPDGSIASPDPNSPLVSPASLALTPSGELLIADVGANRIFRLAVDKTISAFAGTGTLGFSGDGGPALMASFNQPRRVALDNLGNAYVADYFNQRIRRITPDGVIATIAGDGSIGAAGDGGTALEASLGGINGIAPSSDGSIYFCENLNHTIRVIAPDGRISRFAGIDSINGDGNLAAFARLISPRNILPGPNGDLFVADGQNRVRRITRAGQIETIAGSGLGRSYGDNGPATQAGLISPLNLALDSQGNLYLGDGGSGQSGNSFQSIRKVTPDGIITTVAGTGVYGFSGDGGPASEAKLAGPGGVAVDDADNLYIADVGNHRIRRVSPDGIITTVAGNGTAGFSGDGGSATGAMLSSPYTVAVDHAGNLYIADRGNYRIRRVAPDGVITTIGGNGRWGFSGDGGDARNATFGTINGLAIDPDSSLYFADSGSQRVRKISAKGIVTTIAGNGTAGFRGDGTLASLASLSGPRGVAVDSRGVVYIADSDNGRIRKVQGNIAYLADPAALVLSSALGGPRQLRSISVTVPDGNERAFSVSTDAPWLTVTPIGGTVEADAPTILTVAVDPSALKKGSYSGIIHLANPRNSAEFADVGVILTVSGTPQQMRLSQTGLFFATIAGGGAPPQQTFRVLNTGIGGMNWTASTSTLAGGRWLSTGSVGGTSQAGTSGAPVDVRIDPAGLATGSYFGQVQVTAPGVDNSPQSATVVLSVLPANRAPGPAVDPLGMLFVRSSTGSLPSAQTIRIANITNSTVSYTATLSFPDQRTWFSLSQTTGSVLPGAPVSLEVRPVLQALPVGTYRGQVNFRFMPGNTTTQVNMLLVVSPSVSQATSASERATTAACQPSRLAMIFKSPGNVFNTTAGWPVPIDLLVSDDCGQPVTSGQAMVSFSNGDPPVALTGTADGRWTGTWAVRNVRNSITLTARVTQLSPRLEGTAQVSGNSVESADQAVIQQGGVLSAATRKALPPVSPGAAIFVIGSKLGQQQQASGLPLPPQLGNTTAILAGQPMPLRTISDGRIEAVVPFGVADSTVQQLVVRRGNTLSLPEPVVVAAVGPAVFTVDESGYGQGQVFVTSESEDSQLADPNHPARAGEQLTLWCTGLGLVNSSIVAGEAAPKDTPATTRAAVQVTIQGLTATVESAMLAPGLTGVYLVNTVVPDGLIPDASAAVVVTVDGQASPAVTIAVK